MSLYYADRDLLFADFIPQAEMRLPERELTEKFDFVDGCDDLDDFTGAAFLLDEAAPFTIKHYKHGEPDLFTLYMPRHVGTEEAKRNLSKIMDQLDLPSHVVKWSRLNDLDDGPDAVSFEA